MLCGVGTAVAFAACGSDEDAESCITRDSAEVCAFWSDVTVVVEGSGLDPASEFVVKDFDGIEQRFEVEDDGTVNRLKYRQPESGEAKFGVSGTSGDGNDFDGAIVISGPT